MDDGIAAGKRRERLRPQQAMGIGNRANGSHPARPDYKRSRAASPCYRIVICAQKGNPPHAETKGDRTLRCRNDRGLDSTVCLYVIFAVMPAAGIRLDHRKSVRPFKGIIWDHISEFEYSHAVGLSASPFGGWRVSPCQPAKPDRLSKAKSPTTCQSSRP